MNRHINWDEHLYPPGMDVDEFCFECGEEICPYCGVCHNTDSCASADPICEEWEFNEGLK